jgi:hypothetical protein
MVDFRDDLLERQILNWWGFGALVLLAFVFLFLLSWDGFLLLLFLGLLAFLFLDSPAGGLFL